MSKSAFIFLAFLFLISIPVHSQSDYKELSVPFISDANWNKTSKKLQADWASTMVHFDKHTCPFITKTNHLFLKGWKGEKLQAKVLVWSIKEEGELSFALSLPTNKKGMQLQLDSTTTGFLRYVMTDELAKDGKGGCGYRPDKTAFDSSLVADVIDPIFRLKYEAKTVRPIWVTFQIPEHTESGIYKGNLIVTTLTGSKKRLTYSIQVLNKAIPSSNEWTFHLDLWQNPFAIAREAKIPLWSEAHFAAMRPLMKRLAQSGQKVITTSIIHKPWNGQTFDYFESMISIMRKVDGSWIYDYTLFDKWVEFMHSCGINKQISCFSVIPWELTFRYIDQATNSMKDLVTTAGSDSFNDYWISMLSDFAKHLKEKGWFEKTVISMDERPKKSMNAALQVIYKADPLFKISLAGIYHEDLNHRIYDYCISYDDFYPTAAIEYRKKNKLITTFYTYCNQSFPNTFTFSTPAEAASYGYIAANRNLDGYLRWAYNSWVETPLTDSRFHTWAAGDTYLVYPGNRSSVRFEKMIEGIENYEKINVLTKNKLQAQTIKKLLEQFSYEKLTPAKLIVAMEQIEKTLNYN
ncbi:MAG: DUF4091 domain-containing protein [Bacteroides sp.]